MYDPEGRVGCLISDFKEFPDFFRRLTIPYYEEARLYFDQARSDKDIAGDENEILIYTEDFLKRIVERYSIYT